VILTGTLLGGTPAMFITSSFDWRPAKMVAHGYEWGEAGLRSFAKLRRAGKDHHHRAGG